MEATYTFKIGPRDFEKTKGSIKAVADRYWGTTPYKVIKMTGLMSGTIVQTEQCSIVERWTGE